MSIKEIYELFDKIGVLTFSTIHEDEVHSRIAHFNGYDEDGIYFRTMWNKPYARQLEKTGKITVCGVTDSRILGHDENASPEFPPGYSIRLIGKVRPVTEEAIREKAKNNKMLETAAYDMDQYAAMKRGNFVIYAAKVEVFDYDFERKNRDHKILRTRTSFGGMTYNQAGPIITDKCIGCGLCYKNCSFKAIKKGEPYSVISERCDDCGTCISVCPVGAINVSKTF